MQYFRYHMASELAPAGSVLEIGCGSGMGLPYLAAHSRMVVGGDYTMPLLQQAARHVPGGRLVRMDAAHLPFRDATFDAVLMLEMIYYVADQPAAFAECRRILKPGGRLMVCMPNRNRPDFNPSPFSTRYPDVPEVTALFEGAGFEPKVWRVPGRRGVRPRQAPRPAATFRGALSADSQLDARQGHGQARPLRPVAGVGRR